MTTDKHEGLTRDQIKEIKILSSMLAETADKLNQIANRRHPELVGATWLIRTAQKNVDRVIIKLT